MTSLNVKIDYDDDIEIYSLNFHDESDECVQSFSYQDMTEIMDDLRESISQFSTLVKF